MEMNEAMELVEGMFTFDDVGDSMMALRKDIDNAELQKKLASDLVNAVAEDEGNLSDEALDVVREAADARVAEYVRMTKSTKGTGCGR